MGRYLWANICTNGKDPTNRALYGGPPGSLRLWNRAPIGNSKVESAADFDLTPLAGYSNIPV